MTRQERKEYNKRWFRKHPNYVKEQMRKRFEKNPWLRHLANARRRCKRRVSYRNRGIKCFLTKDEIKKLWFRDKAYLLDKPSIDRIEGSKNYTFDNSRFIELKINLSQKKTCVRVCPKCGYHYEPGKEIYETSTKPI